MTEPLFPTGDNGAENPEGRTVRRVTVLNSEGKQRSYRHPELIDAKTDRPLHDNDMVSVVSSEKNEPETIPFSIYLKLIKSEYGDYYGALKRYAQEHDGSVNNHDVLYALHERVLQARAMTAKKLKPEHDKELANRHNYQKETRAHSIVFQKTFNDMGIDGIHVVEAEQEVDKLDGIDEYLIINGIPIGIQRSFRDKTEDVRRDRWRYIPEHPEFGRIPRVFLKEDFEDYGLDSNGQGKSLTQRLYDVRNERAQEKGKQPKELPLPLITSILADDRGSAMKEQGRRGVGILKKVLNELSVYESDSEGEDSEQVIKLMNAVQGGIEEIHGEMNSL